MIRCSLHTSILHYSACSCPMAAYWYNFRTWITYAMRMMYAMWRNHGSREGPREPRRASWRSRGSRRRSRRRRWPVNKRYATRSSSSSYNHPGYILETVRTPLFFPSPFTPPCQPPPTTTTTQVVYGVCMTRTAFPSFASSLPPVNRGTPAYDPHE